MKRLFYVVAFFTLTFSSFAQSEFSLFRMNANAPQASFINPAVYPNHKVIIGLPVISSMRFTADADGFSFRDIFRKSETDSLELDTVSIFQKLKETNHIKFREELQLFFLGIRGKRSFYSFSIQQVGDFRINYPGDLVGWAIRGPGHPAYAGQPLDLKNFYGRTMVYNKISLGYAREVTPWLRIGARLSYILGVAAAETTELNGSLLMGVDSIHVSTGNIRAQTAGIDFFDQENLSGKDYQNYLLNSKNKGMSIDIGGAYDLTDNITLTASLTDLGYINWKDYTRSYEVSPITYTFRGFDLLDYLNKDDGEEFMQAELDSLENLYDFNESTGGSFRTPLIGKFYAGVNMKVLKVNNFSALVYFDMFKKKINPAVSVGYNLQLGRTLCATVGVTYENGRINNVGAGLLLKLTHLQFYASSDRANSFLYPARASKADIRMGMNLVFGKAKVHNPPKRDNETSAVVEQQTEIPQDTTIAPVQEEVKQEEIKQDTVVEVAEPITPAIDSTALNVAEDTTTQVAMIPVQTPVEIEQKKDTVATQPEVQSTTPAVVEAPEPRYEVVKKGSNRDELQAGHYVIVGSFRSRDNAVRYAKTLSDDGYSSKFGFATEKGVYYVYVYGGQVLNEARAKRDEFRKLTEHQFQASWILTVRN